MTAKRSRIYRSSSSGETTALPTPSSAAYFSASKDERVRKAAAMAENRRQKSGIFTISSPLEESIDRRSEEICGFLEKCSFCSKKFPKNADIFMYSYLQAFCSRECRQKQIDIDNNLETLRKKRVNSNTKQVYTSLVKNGGF
ncbi:hypothetical protein RND81_02G012100 [Saponaria officinalis]|uniref:FLZ-type domain-containing protein n=1 Tax=Saponaria officinalis TaxID=3572 RepID=A0AAW1MPE5_SAPOF